MTTSDVLGGALRLLRADGWTKGDYRKPDGSMCIVGALQKASGMNDFSLGNEWVLRCERAYAVLAALVGPSVSQWNDKPETVFVEVEALLTAAVVIAREKETLVNA